MYIIAVCIYIGVAVYYVCIYLCSAAMYLCISYLYLCMWSCIYFYNKCYLICYFHSFYAFVPSVYVIYVPYTFLKLTVCALCGTVIQEPCLILFICCTAVFMEANVIVNTVGQSRHTFLLRNQ